MTRSPAQLAADRMETAGLVHRYATAVDATWPRGDRGLLALARRRARAV